jgi:hypothetical protein
MAKLKMDVITRQQPEEVLKNLKPIEIAQTMHERGGMDFLL